MEVVRTEELLLDREYERAFERARCALDAVIEGQSTGQSSSSCVGREDSLEPEDAGDGGRDRATRASAVLLQAAAEMGMLRAPGDGDGGLEDTLARALGSGAGRAIPAPIALLWYELRARHRGRMSRRASADGADERPSDRDSTRVPPGGEAI